MRLKLAPSLHFQYSSSHNSLIMLRVCCVQARPSIKKKICRGCEGLLSWAWHSIRNYSSFSSTLRELRGTEPEGSAFSKCSLVPLLLVQLTGCLVSFLCSFRLIFYFFLFYSVSSMINLFTCSMVFSADGRCFHGCQTTSQYVQLNDQSIITSGTVFFFSVVCYSLL